MRFKFEIFLALSVLILLTFTVIFGANQSKTRTEKYSNAVQSLTEYSFMVGQIKALSGNYKVEKVNGKWQWKNWKEDKTFMFKTKEEYDMFFSEIVKGD